MMSSFDDHYLLQAFWNAEYFKTQLFQMCAKYGSEN